MRTRKTKRRSLVLTSRDSEVLAFLAAHREITMDVLAARFFAADPFSGKKNASPLKACERRLSTLREHGLVEVSRVRCDDKKARVVVRLASQADGAVGERASRRTIAPRDQSHHLRTVEAVGRAEVGWRKQGGRLVSFQSEAALRAEKQRGRRTARGDRFDAFPDAVCVVAFPQRGGGERIVRVALEYVTSKYTSADISEKRTSFAKGYDEAVWYADSWRTAERVKRLTGGACSILS